MRTKKRIEARRAAKLNGALTKCRIFASLPKAAIGKLIDIMEYEKIDGATVVCREGTVADKMYLIVSGECEVFDGGQTVEDTTDDVVIKTLKSNEIFGESALYHGDNEEFVPRRKKTVRVKEGSILEALVMESVDFRRIKRNGTLNEQTLALLKQVAKERQQENAKRDEARKSSPN